VGGIPQGTFSSAVAAIDGKVSMLISVGTSGDALCRKGFQRLWGEPRGVLDAVGAGGGEVVQGLFAEAVSGDPHPLLVGRSDRLRQHVDRPAGREVATVPVDPVADELDPAVAGSRLQSDLLDELLRLDLPRVVADVATRPRDVTPCTHELGQVVSVVDPAGVHR
jgi:hypothetical protein